MVGSLRREAEECVGQSGGWSADGAARHPGGPFVASSEMSNMRTDKTAASPAQYMQQQCTPPTQGRGADSHRLHIPGALLCAAVSVERRLVNIHAAAIVV